MTPHARDDYKEVVKLEESGELPKDTNIRWEEGYDHHPKSKRLMKFMKDYDFNNCDMYFDWKTGGDGDNGETLMYQLDAFFEMLDKKGETL
jgi:hypothetical protein